MCNSNNIGNLVPQRSSGVLMLYFCGVWQHTLLKMVGLFLWYFRYPRDKLMCNSNNIGNLVPQRSSGVLMLYFCGVWQHTLLKMVGLFLWYFSIYFWNCFGLFLWHM